MELTKRLLFLDDIRYPIEAYHYTKQDIFPQKRLGYRSELRAVCQQDFGKRTSGNDFF